MVELQLQIQKQELVYLNHNTVEFTLLILLHLSIHFSIHSSYVKNERKFTAR